jgi:2-succinyl-6-hydroxy-2,4-cyclohexadiene-1-carboxylate synthase
VNIEANGINYHVEVNGQGPPVLLLHGFTGASENWLPFQAEWHPFFKLISVDIIGHGKTESPVDAGRYSMELVVKDLRFILQALNIKKVSIVGYSMGGRLALSYAAIYPEMVTALILESSSPGLKTEAERKARVVNDHKLAEKILNEGIQSFIDFWESIPLFKSQKHLPLEVQESIRNQRLCNDPIGLANSLLGMGTGKQPSWWDKLHTLQFPVLLLCGEDDQKFCNIAIEMENLLPNSEKLVIEKCGHAIHVEQPKFFGKIVKEYLIKQVLKFHGKG